MWNSIYVNCLALFLGSAINVVSFVRQTHRYFIQFVSCIANILTFFLIATSLLTLLLDSNQRHSVIYLLPITIGIILMVFSLIIRGMFRHWFYPDLYAEHSRIWEEYINFWKERAFTRDRLGWQSNDRLENNWFLLSFGSFYLLNVVEIFWDYCLLVLVNFCIFYAFFLVTLPLAICFVTFNIFILVESFVTFVLICVYPFFALPDLVGSLLCHLFSPSGNFTFIYLRLLIHLIDRYLRFVYCVEFEVSEWIPRRDRYPNICVLIYFFVCHTITGSRAFIIIEDNLTLDHPDGQIFLSLSCIRLIMLETFFASASGLFVGVAYYPSTLSVPLIMLSILILFAEIFALCMNYKSKSLQVAVQDYTNNYHLNEEGSSAGRPEDGPDGDNSPEINYPLA